MADDIVTRLRERQSEVEAWWPDPNDPPLTTVGEAAAEIEQLRRLCSHMASLLDDCQSSEVSIAWVMARLDTLEEWQRYRTERMT